jgi:hypothetical protein
MLRKCDSAGRNISGVLHHKRTRINSPARFCCMIQAKTQPATKDHQTPLVDECPQYPGHGAKSAWPVMPGLLAYNPTSGDFSSGVSGIAVTPTATPRPFLPRERALKTSNQLIFLVPATGLEPVTPCLKSPVFQAPRNAAGSWTRAVSLVSFCRLAATLQSVTCDTQTCLPSKSLERSTFAAWLSLPSLSWNGRPESFLGNW